MLAEKILPLVFVKHSHLPLFKEIIEHLGLAMHRRICLIDNIVVMLPVVDDLDIRLIQQRKHICALDYAVKNFLAQIYLVKEIIVFIGVLGRYDNAKLVGQSYLR